MTSPDDAVLCGLAPEARRAIALRAADRAHGYAETAQRDVARHHAALSREYAEAGDADPALWHALVAAGIADVGRAEAETQWADVAELSRLVTPPTGGPVAG